VSASRVPVGRFAAALALVVGAWAVAHGVSGRLRWKELTPGIEFATLRGEPYCRAGSSTIAILRLDPARVRLRVLHYTRLHRLHPLTSAGWLEYTSALAVFNAGQYYPDYSYMGLLVSGGKVVSATPHPSFRAALVAEPTDSGRYAQARVLDLEKDRIDPARSKWREVAQSFMLFDTSGTPRVKRSDQVANRTVIAEDDHGRIVVVTTEGGYTLWDIAHLLKAAPLGLRHAMAMDGGHEAQLCVHAGGFRYASFGRWPKDQDQPQDADAQAPLPAVVAVVSR